MQGAAQHSTSRASGKGSPASFTLLTSTDAFTERGAHQGVPAVLQAARLNDLLYPPHPLLHACVRRQAQLRAQEEGGGR